MKKLILIVVSLFTLGVWAAEPNPTYNSTVKSTIVTPKLLTKKLKRQLKALHQVPANTLTENDDYNTPDSDDLDLHRAYSNPRVAKFEFPGISDRVANRLKLARALAVQQHQKIWCNGGVV